MNYKSPSTKAKQQKSQQKKRSHTPASQYNQNENNAKLMNCINLLNTKRSNCSQNMVDHHQYMILSKNYDQAQQRLLSQEKTLMQQTLINEKQRSIIEIMKQALSQNMDDDTILSFIVELSKQTPNISEVSQNLLEIRNILEKRKLSIYLKQNKISKLEQTISLVQNRYDLLKNQFLQLEKSKKQYIHEIEKMQQRQKSLKNNYEYEIQLLKMNQNANIQKQLSEKKSNVQKQNLSNNMRDLERQLSQSKFQLKRKEQQINYFKQKITKLQNRERESIQKLQKYNQEKVNRFQEQISNLEQKIKKMETNQQSLRIKHIQQLNQLQRHNQIFKSINQTICNYRHQANSQYNLSNLTFQLKSLLEDKQLELNKCKKRIQKMIKRNVSKESAKQNVKQENCRNQIYILKKFLSEEALKLVGQYQLNPKEYLQKQIVDLAKLEKQKLQHYQKCQKQLWKYKVRLLQLQQNNPNMIETIVNTNKSKSKQKFTERTGKFDCSQFKI